MLVEEALSALSGRERRVITLRFGLEDGRQHTIDEVGKELGLTRKGVCRIERIALAKLRLYKST